MRYLNIDLNQRISLFKRESYQGKNCKRKFRWHGEELEVDTN